MPNRKSAMMWGVLALALATASPSYADHSTTIAADPYEDAAAPPPVDDLTLGMERSMPQLDSLSVIDHVEAARHAAGPLEVDGRWYEVRPEVLLSMAWVESRYVSTAVSRLECNADGTCARRTGSWPRAFPSRFQGPYFCGYLQSRVHVQAPNPVTARARSQSECRAVAADIQGAYTAAVAHIGDWLRFCTRDRVARRHPDRLRCALAGYNGGVIAARQLRPKYPRAVLTRAKRLANGWTGAADQHAI